MASPRDLLHIDEDTARVIRALGAHDSALFNKGDDALDALSLAVKTLEASASGLTGDVSEHDEAPLSPETEVDEPDPRSLDEAREMFREKGGA